MEILRFTAGATPADCIVVNTRAKPFQPTYCTIVLVIHLKHRRTKTHIICSNQTSLGVTGDTKPHLKINIKVYSNKIHLMEDIIYKF